MHIAQLDIQNNSKYYLSSRKKLVEKIQSHTSPNRNAEETFWQDTVLDIANSFCYSMSNQSI